MFLLVSYQTFIHFAENYYSLFLLLYSLPYSLFLYPHTWKKSFTVILVRLKIEGRGKTYVAIPLTWFARLLLCFRQITLVEAQRKIWRGGIQKWKVIERNILCRAQFLILLRRFKEWNGFHISQVTNFRQVGHWDRFLSRCCVYQVFLSASPISDKSLKPHHRHLLWIVSVLIGPKAGRNLSMVKSWGIRVALQGCSGEILLCGHFQKVLFLCCI